MRVRAGLVTVLLAGLVSAAAGESAAVEEPTKAARACVLVRADVAAVRPDEPVLASAGFFLSSSGYVLTTYEAVGGRLVKPAPEADAALPGFPVEVSWAAPDLEGLVSQPAMVVAVSREADLAVLSVAAGGEVPFIPFGDSDGLERPQPVTAMGYPRSVRTTSGTLRSRSPASRPGRVRAFPGGRDTTASKKIETEAARRLGVGGGPLVDEDGYAVGVVQTDVGAAGSVAGAVPINRAKELLEANGLGPLLPPRLVLGSRQAFDAKGVRLPVAIQVVDVAPERTRVLSRPDSSGIKLRIDRIASPAGLGEIERALLSGDAFGGFPAERRGATGDGSRDVPLSRARVFGSAVGTGEEPQAIEYVLMSAVLERLIASYSGPADVVAYNRGVLRRSLEAIEVTRLLLKPVNERVSVTLAGARLPADDAPVVALPAGWTREGVDEPIPPGMPVPDAALSASPKEDFTVAVRTLWWRRAPRTAEEAAAAAGRAPGAHGPGSYLSDTEEFGTSWVASGRFLPVADGLLLLELRAPRDKVRFLETLHQQWLAGLR